MIPPTQLQISLFRTLRAKFTREEIESVCWELGVDFDDLNPRSKTTMARQLVERVARIGKTDTLAQIVRRERPSALIADGDANESTGENTSSFFDDEPTVG
jgi:hypothetical protein